MNIGIILSGGTGIRLGSDIPKQYIVVNNRPVISYSLQSFVEAEEIDGFFIVASSEWEETILAQIKALGDKKFMGFCEPGETRQLSIVSALVEIREHFGGETEGIVVMIHDAARPLLSASDISAYIGALDGHDGVLPVLPMKDTVYFSDDGVNVSSLVDRSRIFAGQAPEVFIFDRYLEANEQIIADSQMMEINGSTEVAIKSGMDVIMVPGNERNFKITTMEDLVRFESIIKD